MKKHNLIIILFCLTFSFAKSQEFEYSLNQGKNKIEWRKKIMEARIKSTKAIKTYPGKKDKQYLQYEYQYDKLGNLIESKTFNRRGKTIGRYTMMHDSRNNETEYIEYRRNGKMRCKFTYEYNDSGYLVNQHSYWKNAAKPGWYYTKTYDKNNKILELVYLYPTRKGDKISTRYEYAYYPDGSRKQTIEYNRKGKIEHEWNYECNPEGSIDSKKLKDTSKVCIRYETDKDGNKITIKEEFVKSGRTVRILSKYNAKGNMIEYAGFDKKGSERYKTTYEYDKNQNLTAMQSFSKGKSKKRYVYECDASGFVSKSYTYTKSDKPDCIYTFEHEKY